MFPTYIRPKGPCAVSVLEMPRLGMPGDSALPHLTAGISGSDESRLPTKRREPVCRQTGAGEPLGSPRTLLCPLTLFFALSMLLRRPRAPGSPCLGLPSPSRSARQTLTPVRVQVYKGRNQKALRGAVNVVEKKGRRQKQLQFHYKRRQA